MRIYILSIAVLAIFTTNAQDTEFSQFNSTPLLQNPANTGMGRGYNRANLLYHSQHTTMGNVYSTMYASADAPIFSHKMQRASGLFATGLHFYNNTEGDADLSTLNVGLSIAGHVDLDYYNKGSVGIQGTYNQQSYNINAIQWDSQYNGTSYDPTLPSNENFNGNSNVFFNMGVGLLWKHFSREENLTGIDKGSFQIGYSLYNITNPSLSLINNSDKQYFKHNVHFKSLFAIGEKHIGLAPSGMFLMQGPHIEYSIGSAFLFYLKSDTKYTGFIKEAYIGMTMHYRHTDAIIPGIVIKVSDIIIGMSYDYSIGKLQNFNGGMGGFEFSLQFNDTYGTLFNQGNMHVTNGAQNSRKL
jgi:type IX secretion system PorP/SprF family membrane protein